jgi:hypothetical protein
MVGQAKKFLARLQELQGEVEDGFVANVYFDEAHTLQVQQQNENVRNSYFSLLSALNALHDLPILFVFLSTNSCLNVFAPQNAPFPSLRVQGGLRLIPPYFELPYDTFAAGLMDEAQTLSDVCKLEYFTKIGRPL